MSLRDGFQDFSSKWMAQEEKSRFSYVADSPQGGCDQSPVLFGLYYCADPCYPTSLLWSVLYHNYSKHDLLQKLKCDHAIPVLETLNGSLWSSHERPLLIPPRVWNCLLLFVPAFINSLIMHSDIKLAFIEGLIFSNMFARHWEFIIPGSA